MGEWVRKGKQQREEQDFDAAWASGYSAHHRCETNFVAIIQFDGGILHSGKFATE
jgi:hypothetical protein